MLNKESATLISERRM